MKRFICGILFLLSIGAISHAAQFKIGSHTFTLPDGFEIQQVTDTNLVMRPIEADFDELGRLYVTDSSGSNDKVQKQLEDKPHRVVRLEDTDGDGKFDRSIVFADRMMFPEGAMWYDGSLYVSAPPSIWKLTDTNNDGVADVRVEWFQGKTLTGCANDLHGPYLGPDGWIYWCKGAFAEQTHQVNGKTFKTRASHIFRARPDGTGLEPVMTGGMDNPVGLAFSAEGDRFVAGTFFQHPEGGRRDGIIHAIYGGVYGKQHDVLDGHKRTGELMPIMTHLGPAAPCGMVRYESRGFGAEFQDNLFVCCFNLHKVTRHVLEPDGATFKTRDTDFLVSDNTDFHPTDVLEDADGSLLVIDTGGWYKLCCPTSQLYKPDVLGAIYRIRRKGAPKVEDPRGLKIPWTKLKPADLARFLDDERPVVAKRAMDELVTVGAAAIETLNAVVSASSGNLDRLPGTVAARRNAIWALRRIGSSEARGIVMNQILSTNYSVVLTAIHAHDLGSFGSRMVLLGLLDSRNLRVRRGAAQLAGRWKVKAATSQLLAGATEKNREMEHSAIYALIEINDPVEVRSALKNIEQSDPASLAEARRCALIALDQMESGDLKPEEVVPLLSANDPITKQTAMWILGHHAEWGDALAGYFRQQLSAKLSESQLAELGKLLPQFSSNPLIQKLFAEILSGSTSSGRARQLVLESIGQTSFKEVPAALAGAINTLLTANDPPLLHAAVAAARALSQVKTNAPNFSPALLRLGQDSKQPADLRLEALAALPRGLTSVDFELHRFLTTSVDPNKVPAMRNNAAQILAKAKLTHEQLFILVDMLKQSGPMELIKLLPAFAQGSSEELGLKLIEALRQSKGAAALRAEILKPILAKYPSSVQREGEQLVASLNVDAAKQKAHIDELLAVLKEGDVRRGQFIFNSARAACSTCHAMGYLGGKVGPDLTRIGQVRNERDLLEAIVYPSASFVRSYEPVVVATRSGEEFNGILKKDAPDEVVLVTGPNAETRVARNEISEVRPGTVSVMPGGLADQLDRRELADLVAFLKATK